MHAKLSHVSDAQPPVSLMLVMANPLDREAIAMLFAHRRRFRIVYSTCSLDDALQRVPGLAPDVVVVDPQCGEDSIEKLSQSLASIDSAHLLVLDTRVHESRLVESIRAPSASYYTRKNGAEQFVETVRTVATGGERLFDPAVSDRVYRSTTGIRLRVDLEEPSIHHLTARELDVMRLIALGYTVRESAERLDVSISTVDNHKSRLMKKLGLAKSQHLTRLAIREGMILP